MRPLLQRYPVERLVLFRALQLGDMLCAVPALRALRGALPAARITLVGLPWAEQFAARFSGYIDHFLPFPGHPLLPEQPVQRQRVRAFYAAVRAARFDLAVQMHGSGQVSNRIVRGFGAPLTAGHVGAAARRFDRHAYRPYPAAGPEPLRLLGLAEFLGAAPAGSGLEFPLNQADERALAASGVAHALAPGPYICLHPGARTRAKCWPPHCFAAVADRLAEEFSVSVALTGSASETDLTAAVARHMRTRAVDAAGLPLGAMAALMRGARLLVCNDTGVSHIAAGLRLASVVIFSQSDPARWAPLDTARHRWVRDPGGAHAGAVLEQARRLLAAGGTQCAAPPA